MLSLKESIIIILTGIVLAFAVSLTDFGIFTYALVSVFLILLINTLAKKISAFYLDSEIEVRLWEIQRYGFRPKSYFKKPFPAGVFFPVASKIILFPFKYFVWMASLVFEVKPRVYRAAKRHGLYNFSGITEYHMALIAVAGVIFNLIGAVAGYLLGYTLFAKLSIYYALFSMIPLSDLDGNKIFFGSIVLWCFLASLTLVGLFFNVFVI